MKRTIILVDSARRKLAKKAIDEAPEGYAVVIREPSRSLEQNALIHPLVRDIRRYMVKHGAPARDEEWWRYYLLAKYAGQEMVRDPDGSGQFVYINRHAGTSGLGKDEASKFIDWMQSFGVDIGMEEKDWK